MLTILTHTVSLVNIPLFPYPAVVEEFYNFMYDPISDEP